MAEALAHTVTYTEKDYYNLPENVRAELIDGQFYYMSAPSRLHQQILGFLFNQIANYIRKNKGSCEVYPAPFAVFLNADDKTYVEPDVSVICDKNKLDEYGCNGAPDWIVEIISPSTERMDYEIKLFKYRSAGVREYWIINPSKQTVMVYDFEHGRNTKQYSFDDTISGCIYQDLKINITNLL